MTPVRVFLYVFFIAFLDLTVYIRRLVAFLRLSTIR